MKGEKTTITYLVHIGFDRAPQLQLIENIKTRIDSLVPDKNQLVSFANEPNHTIEEVACINVFELAESLRAYIHGSQLFSAFRDADFLSRLSMVIDDKMPPEVKIFLEEKIGKQITEFKKPIPGYFEELDITRSPSPELKERIQQKNAEFEAFLKSQFVPLLKELIEKFGSKNLYNKPIGDTYETPEIDVSNIARYNELVSYAQKKLGVERVMFLPMGNHDIFNLMNTFNTEKDAREEEYQIYFEARKKLIDLRLSRYSEYIKKEFTQRNIGDTDHILGGEYLEACVTNFGVLIQKVLGIPGAQRIDEYISIKTQ